MSAGSDGASWTWLIPTVPATVSAVIGVLIYRHQQQQSPAVAWTVETEKAGAFRTIVLTNIGHATARDVTVELEPAQIRPGKLDKPDKQNHDARPQDVDAHGGSLRVQTLAAWNQSQLAVVTVHWGSKRRPREWSKQV